MSLTPAASFIAALACASAVRAGAQATASGTPAGRPCNGDSITAIDIRTYPPSRIGALDDMSRATAKAVWSQFSATRPGVVRAYLLVKEGHVCTELHRSESERLLRAQPFIASAAVRTIPDGPGRVRVQVDVVDELPVIIGGGLRRGKVAAVTLGTLNLGGRGLALTVQGMRGFAYRGGLGMQVAKYGAFGRPYYVAASAERSPLGDEVSLVLEAPFLTPLQRRAARAGGIEASDYFAVVRPEGPDVSLQTRRVSYDVGWVTRVGTLDRHHNAGFVGVSLLGETIHIGNSATIVSDTGIVRAPDVTFGSEYPNIGVVRVAAIGGLRSVHFMTVRGFDALAAQQDIGAGIQVGVLAGPSVWALGGKSEIFTAGDVYIGAGRETSLLSAHLVAEARGNYHEPKWHGIVSSARLSWYKKPSPRRTRVISLNIAAVRHLDFPAQLTLRDADGGVAGFGDSRAAGGSRVVARIEERRLTGLFRTRADLAAAVFADAGKLWAGDVPYGQTAPVRASMGLSLLAAYPAGGKRTYRVDVAFPLNPERGGARVELRLSALDRTRLLWLEPRDVARMRTGAVPATLMRW